MKWVSILVSEVLPQNSDHAIARKISPMSCSVSRTRCSGTASACFSVPSIPVLRWCSQNQRGESNLFRSGVVGDACRKTLRHRWQPQAQPRAPQANFSLWDGRAATQQRLPIEMCVRLVLCRCFHRPEHSRPVRLRLRPHYGWNLCHFSRCKSARMATAC
jgi:hypothetical protein